ncbi:MAG: metallophosphoesterase [Kiritimatiellia bacterium]
MAWKRRIFLLTVLAGFFLVKRWMSNHLPQNADLTIVHLTDLHLSSHGTSVETPWTHKIKIGGYGLHYLCTGKAFALFDKAVTLINSNIKPDVVVITGDIVDYGDDMEALAKGAAMIRRLECPVIIAKGDHDIARKEANQGSWQAAFGQMDGVMDVKGFPFFHIPFEADAQTFVRMEERINRLPVAGHWRFLSLHRMLCAPRLMDRLAKWYSGCSVLDPNRDAILKLLEMADARWVVLCGHSHMDYQKRWGNITQFTTPSLTEYPHAFRIIKIRNDEVRTAVVRLDRMTGE